jgi:hypothetical protein
MAILIPLTRNQFAIVDEDMEKSLSAHRWCVNKGYARRSDYSTGAPVVIYMAVAIMNPPDGSEVDHRNGNPLDNRRENLRITTPVGNGRNKGPSSRNTSGFCGVAWVKRLKRWQAQIGVSGKSIHLGYFKSAKAASSAYQKAAAEHFGEFKRDAATVSDPVITKIAERPAVTKKNTSGVNGVSFDNGRQRWLAQIRVGKKTVRIGRFTTKEAAVAARDEALARNAASREMAMNP